MASEIVEDIDEIEPGYTTVSTTHTVVPRYIAASIDNLLAMVLSIAAAKTVGSDKPILQASLLVLVYLGYFFLFEALFCRTPGKFLTGLVIVDTEGNFCSWKQTIVRSVFRLLEVNPLLFGGIPAAISVVFSPYHQRFGDRLAKTLVVESRVLGPSR
jgi:uncharacterized RDD family membrane protein YckC